MAKHQNQGHHHDGGNSGQGVGNQPEPVINPANVPSVMAVDPNCCIKDQALADPIKAITDGVLTYKNYASFGISTDAWVQLMGTWRLVTDV